MVFACRKLRPGRFVGAGLGPRGPNFGGGGSKVRSPPALAAATRFTRYGGQPCVPRSKQYFMSSASRLDGPNE